MRNLILVITLLSTLALTGCAGLNERMNARLQMELRERQAMLDAGYVPVPATPHYHGGHHGGYDHERSDAFNDGFNEENRLANFRDSRAERDRGFQDGKAGISERPNPRWYPEYYLNGYKQGKSALLESDRQAGQRHRRSY